MEECQADVYQDPLALAVAVVSLPSARHAGAARSNSNKCIRIGVGAAVVADWWAVVGSFSPSLKLSVLIESAMPARGEMDVCGNGKLAAMSKSSDIGTSSFCASFGVPIAGGRMLPRMHIFVLKAM